MTVLVTGATDGIGLQTALELAERGAQVILHGRSAARLDAALATVRARVPGAALASVRADFASLDAIRAMAAELPEVARAARLGPLDVLVNNAGIYANEPVLTADGFESTFGVNHLAPFLLTHLLVASGADLRRIVSVSSVAHLRGKLDPDTWRDLARFDPYRTYAQSKLANVLMTVALARRLPHVAVSALHPGVVSTKLLVDGFGMQGPDSLGDGAATSVFLASDPAAAPGALAGPVPYYVRQRPSAASPLARDPAVVEGFYQESARLVGVAPLPLPA